MGLQANHQVGRQQGGMIVSQCGKQRSRSVATGDFLHLWWLGRMSVLHPIKATPATGYDAVAK
jgi:hypothetical protein